MAEDRTRARGPSFAANDPMISKRNRTGSISGRLRAASDLADYGVIAADDKGLVKDLIITEDPEFLIALDKFAADPSDQSAVQKIIKTSSKRRGSIDLLEGIDLDYLGGDIDEDPDVDGMTEPSYILVDGEVVDVDDSTQATKALTAGSAGQGGTLPGRPRGISGVGVGGQPKLRGASATGFEMFGNYFNSGPPALDGAPSFSATNNVPTFAPSGSFDVDDLEGLDSGETLPPPLQQARPRFGSMDSDWGSMRPRLDSAGDIGKALGGGPTGLSFNMFDVGFDMDEGGRSRAGSIMPVTVPPGALKGSKASTSGGALGQGTLHGGVNVSFDVSDVPARQTLSLAKGPPPTFQELLEGKSNGGMSVPQFQMGVNPNPYAITPPPGVGSIGAYTATERRARIARFMEKRSRRVWTKRVKYDVRKNFADSRIRVKGRFVKKEDENALRNAGLA